jgi:hypothetical protein
MRSTEIVDIKADDNNVSNHDYVFNSSSTILGPAWIDVLWSRTTVFLDPLKFPSKT